MALTDFFKSWYVQTYKEAPPLYPIPGQNIPFYELGDGVEIQGAFNQDKSSEVRIAEAQGLQTIGTFTTLFDPLRALNVPEPNDILRSKDGNYYIRLTGLPVESPVPASESIRTFDAEIIPRPTG